MLTAKNVRYILSRKNRVILTSVVLSQYTRLADDDRQHVMTIAGHCYEITMTAKNLHERISPSDI